MAKLMALFLVFFLSCASTQTIGMRPSETPTEPRTSAIIGLVGIDDWGHACPVSFDGNLSVFSARHLLMDDTPDGEEFASFVWEDYEGRKGLARTMWADDYQDLGLLMLDGDTPRFYVMAVEAPKRGDKVWWREFEPKTKDILDTRERKAEVVRVRLGHIIVDDAPIAGASGSCLLNERSEVVGIVVWAAASKDAKIGGAVLLTAEEIRKRMGRP